MLPESLRWVVEGFEPDADPWLLLGVARDLEDGGNLEGAAAALDRAFGIDPALPPVAEARARVLDALAVVEHGLTFRYVPEGPFLMGSRDGEPDEAPLRPVWLSAFWIADVPTSWAAHCALLDWHQPSNGMPRDALSNDAGFRLRNINKIRLQYCEDHTTRAVGWHVHIPPNADWVQSTGPRRYQPPRPADAPWGYTLKPVVAVGWQEAEEAAARLSSAEVRYSLPGEAQWEKAARGGLVGERWPWGDEPPDEGRCDFGRFRGFAVRPSKATPPNGYGLYAMAGGVWEWTRDWYDAGWYERAADRDPEGPPGGKERVIRGGSWADCAEAVRVAFRASLQSASWRDGPVWGCAVPTVGYRVCRVVQRTSRA